MASRAEKALAAVIRYEESAARVADITKQIGEAINRCSVAVEFDKAAQSWPFDDRKYMENGKLKTHLYLAFNEETMDDSGYGGRSLRDGEIEVYLTEEETGCPHCAEAWRLINLRKEARRQFGRAKLAIRGLGKAAIAERETP